MATPTEHFDILGIERLTAVLQELDVVAFQRVGRYRTVGTANRFVQHPTLEPVARRFVYPVRW